MRKVLFALVLVLALAAQARAGQDVVIHFVVVSGAVAVEDMDAALNEFRAEASRLAGGYTEFATSGGSLHDGVLSSAPSAASFLIAAPTDISQDLLAAGMRIFNHRLFILSWPGGFTQR